MAFTDRHGHGHGHGVCRTVDIASFSGLYGGTVSKLPPSPGVREQWRIVTTYLPSEEAGGPKFSSLSALQHASSLDD